MTKQLIINGVKINSANTISLPPTEFKKGFNIICGSNEAGKSTMMNFLKNCFHEPLGLIGDIDLSIENVKYQIKVDGNQRKVDNRLKLLAPENKTLEDILPQIDKSFYQKAFSINLDDIKNIDAELFEIIQDHNAKDIRKYKSKLEAEIKTYLTDKGKATKEVTTLQSKIKDIDININKLTLKEKDYYEISNSLKSTEADIAELNKKIENKKLFQAETAIKADIETITQSINTLKLNFNPKLSENKQSFFDINNKTALIIKNIEELNTIINSKLSNRINELLSNIERDYNLKLSIKELEQIDISREFDSKLRSLQEEINQQTFQIKEYESKKSSIEKELLAQKQELETLNSEIQKLNISNPTLFQEGITELRDAISSLADLTDTMPEKGRKLTNIIYSITSLALIGYGLYLHNTVGIIIGCAGLLIFGVTAKDLLNKSKPTDSASKIYDYIKKEILPKLNKEGNFLQTISALNTIVTTEEAKLREFERFQKEVEKRQADTSRINAEKTNIEQSLTFATEVLTNLNSKSNSLTTIKEKTFSIEVIYELINDIRELRELLAKQEYETKQKEILEQDINSYIKEYSEFLATTNLDTSINKTAQTQHTLEQIELNEKCKHDIDALEKQLTELKGKQSSTTIEDLSPEHQLQDLESEITNLNVTLGTLKEKKSLLESFEGIISEQNDKNILKQRINNIIENTLIKKLTFNLIKQAEKQVRETEPNLINAENLLKLITNSKYTGADYSSKMIISANGELKNENELSRGTREQLYLAFRLGYAQNYGANGINSRLPLIIDDAFVNFDRTRLTNVLIALKEFSKTNQILFFTCHKEYITSLIDTNDVNIIDLN